MPGKVLIEKAPSEVGFEGVSQLSCGQENAFKVKVRNSFDITHRQAREQGPLGEPQGHRTPEGETARWVTGHNDKEDTAEEAYLCHDKDLELSERAVKTIKEGFK